MELAKAMELVSSFREVTQGIFECLEVAGSVRRQRPEPKDIDLVAIPQYIPVSDMFGEPTEELVFPFGLWVTENADVEVPASSKVLRRGDNISHIRKIVPFYWQGEKVEVYIGTLDNFAILWLIRTGPAQQNQALASRALRMGKSLSYNRGLVTVRTQEVQTFQTEEEVFAALGLPYMSPEGRDHPDWIKLIQGR